MTFLYRYIEATAIDPKAAFHDNSSNCRVFLPSMIAWKGNIWCVRILKLAGIQKSFESTPLEFLCQVVCGSLGAGFQRTKILFL